MRYREMHEHIYEHFDGRLFLRFSGNEKYSQLVPIACPDTSDVN